MRSTSSHLHPKYILVKVYGSVHVPHAVDDVQHLVFRGTQLRRRLDLKAAPLQHHLRYVTYHAIQCLITQQRGNSGQQQYRGCRAYTGATDW